MKSVQGGVRVTRHEQADEMRDGTALQLATYQGRLVVAVLVAAV